MEMFSRYIPFLSPPSQQAASGSDEDDEDDEDARPQTQHPLPPPPIPPPAQFPSHPTTSFARLRSLSRSSAWNVLPPLPSFEQMQLDCIDFWCQAVLLETDPEQSALYQNYLFQALRVPSKTAPPNALIEARLKLAARAKELVRWQLGQVGNDRAVSPYNFTPDDWKRLQDEWNQMRDAVVQARPEHAQDDLLQGDFRAVGRLLHYQHTLVVFRSSLHKEHPMSVQEAIEMLENGWFGGDFLLDVGDDEEQSLAPEETMVPRQIRHLLEPVKKRRPDIEECLRRYRDLLWGDESNEFSHAHLQHAMHALIIRWSENILGIPTLFQLRYAGVAPYTVQDPENDEISSFGDEDEAKKRRDQERMFHARFEDPVAAIANNVADPEVVAQMESVEPTVDPVVNCDETKHLSDDVGEAAKKAADSIDENVRDTESNMDEEDDYLETQPSVDTQKVRIQQQRFVASKRVLLSTGHADPPRPFTQSQESAAQDMDSGLENKQETKKKRMDHSKSSTRITEPRIVDENVPVQKEQRKRDSLMDSSDEDERPMGPKKQKRNKFTPEEEDAIREGVKRYGVGHWKHIKENDSRLGARTTVQIKDKYRNLLQKGEI
ncbi:hypothetical protein FisN_9Lh345 [Fistulifera solaris]|uniref:Uncharacterized protein n=1 Tax=Fistulifera solaris TaxID=1519565 RepID=A0A1Z5KL72_FISSO|nr:hypothetical protein FisN_9Lh345 [Fistulifera solaris]|eukprot:GAX27029.1 hypothetical protein FisN_9Lh345 [Fistulifera solaris]